MTTSLKERLHANLRTPPMRFQIRGVRFLERQNGRGILGDDMGLGKTYQTLAWLKLHPEALPAVIICPATLKYGWQREMWNHAGLEAEVGEGRRPEALDGDIWILNYDILAAWLPWLLERGKPKTLIIDECQKVKNRLAKRTVACKKLAASCRYVIGLSGTPITNGPAEFFPMLNMVAPANFNSWTAYAFRYCGPKHGFRGHWDFKGASNLEELHERLRPHMLRRMKEEVLPDLPKKTRTIIPVKIDMREYNQARDAFAVWLAAAKGPEAVRRAKGAEALVKLGELKRLAARGKLPAIKEWIGDWLGDLRDRKLVLFAVHKAVVGDLSAAFPGAAIITGDIAGTKRQAIVDRFQDNPACRLFLGNLQAAGEGLTLTASSTVAFAELGWVPAEHEQAEDRVLRIGQKAGHVDSVYLIAKGTIEEDILELIEAKRNVVGQVLDGDAAARTVQTQIIEKLLKQRR